MKRQTTHKPSLLLLTTLSLLFLFSFVPPGAADPAMFIRGDADGDGKVALTDAIYILQYLYLTGPQPACLDFADSNDDGRLDITDAIAILSTLFLGENKIAPFYPKAFYDWTTNDPDVCGDIPAWLKEMLQNPVQPAPDPTRDPFAGPGLWDNLAPPNPIMKAVAMIRLMSPMEWDALLSTNKNLYDFIAAINKLDFDILTDYEDLLGMLQWLGGWETSGLVSAGLPYYVADSLSTAIETAQNISAPDLQNANLQQTQSVMDSVTGQAPGLHKMDAGDSANPDEKTICYVCGSQCNQSGSGSSSATDHQCGIKVAYDIYFSPAATPGPSGVTFLQQLVNESKKLNASQTCCKHYVYVRIPKTNDSVGVNGKAAAEEMKAELNKIAGKGANGDQCVREVTLNIYCFCASCVEVIHFVQNLGECDTPCGGCRCCNENFDKIKKNINIVSMEGLFNGAPGIFGGIANFCTGMAGWALDATGIPGAYACSAMSEEYGGAEPPCVCSFNAYSRDPGAGSTDPNLSQWQITSHQITAENHADFPNALSQNAANWSEIAPGCGCKETPAIP